MRWFCQNTGRLATRPAAGVLRRAIFALVDRTTRLTFLVGCVRGLPRLTFHTHTCSGAVCLLNLPPEPGGRRALIYHILYFKGHETEFTRRRTEGRRRQPAMAWKEGGLGGRLLHRKNSGGKKAGGVCSCDMVCNSGCTCVTAGE